MAFMLRRSLVIALLASAAAACGRKAETALTASDAALAAANAGTAKTFLAKNAKEPGVMTTASGLQYKITRSGPVSGEKPGPRDEVKVHYEGTLLDGSVFDSSYRSGQAAVFPVNGVIPGWIEALQLMRPGDEWIVYVPPALAYGEHSPSPTIPPNSLLVFRMELLGVLKTGPANA